jgi:histidinol-phosphate/aromatic aminotransferase/cobyric acid decarboxylase-like protein
VIVRYFPGPVTGKYVRISIGTEQQVSRLFLLTRQIYS